MKKEIKKLITEYLVLSVLSYGLLYLLINIKIGFLNPLVFLLMYFPLPLLALIYASRISNRIMGSAGKKILIFCILIAVLFFVPFFILSILSLIPSGF